MRKSLKIVAVAAVLLIAVGAVAYVYACSQNGSSDNANGQWMGFQGMQTSSEWQNFTCTNNVTMPWGYMTRMPKMRGNGLPWGYGLLQNATLSNVTGTVVSVVRGMLVLDTSSSEVRVLLPNEWTVGNEVVSSATLFNSTFASQGSSVTITVLETNLFSNASFSINEMMGYEAINAAGTTAYAVLPFNIQPAS
jgi:hypothetical protein